MPKFSAYFSMGLSQHEIDFVDISTDYDTPVYRWKQTGQTQSLNNWITEQSSTVDGFLKLIEKCKSWRVTNSKVSYPLNKRDISAFMDYDMVVNRLKLIAVSPHEESAFARELLNAIKIGRDDFAD